MTEVTIEHQSPTAAPAGYNGPATSFTATGIWLPTDLRERFNGGAGGRGETGDAFSTNGEPGRHISGGVGGRRGRCLDCQTGMPCAWCSRSAVRNLGRNSNWPFMRVLTAMRDTLRRLWIIPALVLTLNACGGDGFTETVVRTELVKCPARVPTPTCTIDLPVDVSDPFALGAFTKAPTPREGAQRMSEALRGWAACAAEVRPYRAGRASCDAE